MYEAGKSTITMKLVKNGDLYIGGDITLFSLDDNEYYTFDEYHFRLHEFSQIAVPLTRHKKVVVNHQCLHLSTYKFDDYTTVRSGRLYADLEVKNGQISVNNLRFDSRRAIDMMARVKASDIKSADRIVLDYIRS